MIEQTLYTDHGPATMSDGRSMLTLEACVAGIALLSCLLLSLLR